MISRHPFVERWFPDERIHWIELHRHIRAHTPAGGKMLDLGCGSNGLLSGHRSSECEAWGADFETHPELQDANWFRPLNADGTIPFEDNSFDLVCSHMVMEHVAVPTQFLGEIARVLKPGGRYVGQSIHSRHYVTWIRRLFDLVPHRCVQLLVKKLYGREEHDTFPTCYRMNSRRALAQAARATNLELEDWEGYAHQGYFLFSPLALRCAVLFDWSLEKILPGMGKLYFTVILRKSAPILGLQAGKANAA